jgi:hypothetical protein
MFRMTDTFAVDPAGGRISSGHQPAAGAGLAPAHGGRGSAAAAGAGASGGCCCRSGGHAPDPAAALVIARQAAIVCTGHWSVMSRA